ncbi:hypothetical protein NE462_27710, partial [Blautia hominis]|nr:hypothetical protein [Blautia hominis]
DTLTPPPVLPAQAPTNMRMTRIVLDISGHVLKSVVANLTSYVAKTIRNEFEIQNLKFQQS